MNSLPGESKFDQFCFVPDKKKKKNGEGIPGNRNMEYVSDTFETIAQDCLKEGYNDTKVYLMHSVPHVHHIYTEMRNKPESIKEHMRTK